MPDDVPASPALTGRWGTPGATLVVDARSSRLDLESATASIDGPLNLDAAGRF